MKTKNNNSKITKNDMLSELQKSSAYGSDIAEIGRLITKNGTYLHDTAESLLIAAENSPNDYDFSKPFERWKHLNIYLESYTQDAYKVEPVINTLGGTAVFSSDFYLDTGEEYQYNYNNPQIPTPNYLETNDIFLNGGIYKNVNELLILLGLDKREGKDSSSLELFTLALEAYKNPVISEPQPSLTSLISLRESIRLSINYLLRKRPTQEETRGNEEKKFNSILSQLKYDQILISDIQNITIDWKELLNNYLSPAKNKSLSRREWLFRLKKGCSFFQAFLGAINPSKLRK
jgi:hypothetical protein